ncbi:MAG: lysylphosphatidylglycerol synthase domain-containing protein [Egibacteraceae bacterium]
MFFVGQLGQYLPGSVWPVVAQAALGRDHGVPPRASVAAVALFLLVALVTGGIVAAVTLATAGVVPWPVSLLALPGLALLAPTPLAWLLGRGARIVRRRPFERLPDTATMRRAAGWAAAMWIAYAAHLAAALTAFEAGAPLALAAGAFAAAWCAGFLFLIAPAGAGARDVAMIALLRIGVAAAPAIAAVLASRLLLTLADVGWGLAGLVAGRRRVASAVARSDRRR